MLSFTLLEMGIRQEKLERISPTPPEFLFMARWTLRWALAILKKADLIGSGAVEWGYLGRSLGDLRTVLDWQLEDKALEHAKEGGDTGADMGGFDGEKVFLEDVGWTGRDVSLMTDDWIQGYVQTMMGLGKAAEHLEGWVMDKKTKRKFYPGDVVLGPSNPDPRQMDPDQGPAPLEEDCMLITQRPEAYYLNIATTRGLNTKQRLDAVLAYADWLAFQGQDDAALAAYHWGLDVALQGAQQKSKTSNFHDQAADTIPAAVGAMVDTKTGLINPDFYASGLITSNLVSATTALALFHARSKDVQSALPIFLSLLKTRKELPLDPEGQKPFEFGRSIPGQENVIEFMRNLVYPPPYPEIKTGNETLYRDASNTCEEAALKAYVGEILFATAASNPSKTSNPHEQGLSWTRAAVEMAESILNAKPEDADRAARGRCGECLETGLGNWKMMVREMVINAESELESSGAEAGFSSNDAPKPSPTSSWTSWMPLLGNSTRREKEKVNEAMKWVKEEEILNERIAHWKEKSRHAIRIKGIGMGAETIMNAEVMR